MCVDVDEAGHDRGVAEVQDVWRLEPSLDFVAGQLMFYRNRLITDLMILTEII